MQWEGQHTSFDKQLALLFDVRKRRQEIWLSHDGVIDEPEKVRQLCAT